MLSDIFFGLIPALKISRPNLNEALKKGLVNLGRHIENMKKFGVPIAVAVNHFVTDTEAEVDAIDEGLDLEGRGEERGDGLREEHPEAPERFHDAGDVSAEELERSQDGRGNELGHGCLFR